jgi:predicted transposase YdaD
VEESNIYPEILQDGEAIQIMQDNAEASFEDEQAIILRQLDRRIGEVSPDVQSQIRTLSLYQLEALAEALLDFSEPTDLINWLESNDG